MPRILLFLSTALWRQRLFRSDVWAHTGTHPHSRLEREWETYIIFFSLQEFIKQSERHMRCDCQLTPALEFLCYLQACLLFPHPRHFDTKSSSWIRGKPSGKSCRSIGQDKLFLSPESYTRMYDCCWMKWPQLCSKNCSSPGHFFSWPNFSPIWLLRQRERKREMGREIGKDFGPCNLLISWERRDLSLTNSYACSSLFLRECSTFFFLIRPAFQPVEKLEFHVRSIKVQSHVWNVVYWGFWETSRCPVDAWVWLEHEMHPAFHISMSSGLVKLIFVDVWSSYFSMFTLWIVLGPWPYIQYYPYIQRCLYPMISCSLYPMPLISRDRCIL